MDHLLTSEEVADYLRVDVVTVRRLINRGDLTAYHIGNEFRFMKEDVDDFVKRQRVPTGRNNQNQEPFKNFSERARKVMKLAADEAQSMGHTYIGTEHVLLGLIEEGEGIAAQVLRSFDVQLNQAHDAILSFLEQGQKQNPITNKVKAAMFQGEQLLFGRQGALTERVKKVVRLAVDEARKMEDHFVGTEHLLLGLLDEGEGLAIMVLKNIGIDLQKMREKTLELLQQRKKAAHTASSEEKQPEKTPLTEDMRVCSKCGSYHPAAHNYCFRCGNAL